MNTETYGVSDAVGVQRSVDVLLSGGVILYPTDTLYGLGADALSNEAVDRVYAIKGRDEGKPMHAIVADLEMAERYAYVSDIARQLVKKHWPGPLTLILKKREEVTSGIGRTIETFGVRVPDNAFCRDLVRAYGKPITTTSANRSGEMPERTVAAIMQQLGTQENLGCVIDGGELPERLPSTVVDVSGKDVKILRVGAIASQDISWTEVLDDSEIGPYERH